MASASAVTFDVVIAPTVDGLAATQGILVGDGIRPIALEHDDALASLRALPPESRAVLVVDAGAASDHLMQAAAVLAAVLSGKGELAYLVLRPDQLSRDLTALIELGGDKASGATVEPIATASGTAMLVRREQAADSYAPDALLTLLGLLSRPVVARVPLTVGFVGTFGVGWLGRCVRQVTIDPGGRGSLADHSGGGLDFLVVDPDPEEFHPRELLEIAAESRALGAVVVQLVQPGQEGPVSDVADVTIAIGRDLAPPIDVRTTNPRGFEETTNSTYAVPNYGGLSPEATAHANDAAASAVGAAGQLTAVESDGSPETLRPFLAVVDHGALHEDMLIRCARLVRHAAAGVPVLCADRFPAELEAMLGAELAAALQATTADVLEDPLERSRHSVRARRIALREHAAEQVWRRWAATHAVPLPPPPKVSILLATNRPQFLEQAISHVNAQTYQPRELIVVLHGDDFPPDTERGVTTTAGGDVRVIRADSALNLGDVLNLGLAHATGQLVTKMDDDDWYSPSHVADLVMTLDYSGAHIVGKAAEFVYLAAHDLLVRRLSRGAESESRTIAGGSLMFYRSVAEALGGFRRVATGEDQQLLNDATAAGLKVYRTHGFGYVLHRHGRHAWDVPPDYFVAQAEQQHRGFDMDWATA